MYYKTGEIRFNFHIQSIKLSNHLPPKIYKEQKAEEPIPDLSEGRVGEERGGQRQRQREQEKSQSVHEASMIFKVLP